MTDSQDESYLSFQAAHPSTKTNCFGKLSAEAADLPEPKVWPEVAQTMSSNQGFMEECDIVHTGITCAVCGEKNFKGIRYFCMTCPLPSANFCRTCFKGLSAMTHHYVSHEVLEMSVAFPPQLLGKCKGERLNPDDPDQRRLRRQWAYRLHHTNLVDGTIAAPTSYTIGSEGETAAGSVKMARLNNDALEHIALIRAYDSLTSNPSSLKRIQSLFYPELDSVRQDLVPLRSQDYQFLALRSSGYEISSRMEMRAKAHLAVIRDISAAPGKTLLQRAQSLASLMMRPLAASSDYSAQGSRKPMHAIIRDIAYCLHSVQCCERRVGPTAQKRMPTCSETGASNVSFWEDFAETNAPQCLAAMLEKANLVIPCDVVAFNDTYGLDDCRGKLVSLLRDNPHLLDAYCSVLRFL